MHQSSQGSKSKQSSSSKNMHKRDCAMVSISPISKENDNMREVSIKLMAIMRAKKECSII